MIESIDTETSGGYGQSENPAMRDEKRWEVCDDDRSGWWVGGWMSGWVDG